MIETSGVPPAVAREASAPARAPAPGPAARAGRPLAVEQRVVERLVRAGHRRERELAQRALARGARPARARRSASRASSATARRRRRRRRRAARSGRRRRRPAARRCRAARARRPAAPSPSPRRACRARPRRRSSSAAGRQPAYQPASSRVGGWKRTTARTPGRAPRSPRAPRPRAGRRRRRGSAASGCSRDRPRRDLDHQQRVLLLHQPARDRARASPPPASAAGRDRGLGRELLLARRRRCGSRGSSSAGRRSPRPPRARCSEVTEKASTRLP